MRVLLRYHGLGAIAICNHLWFQRPSDLSLLHSFRCRYRPRRFHLWESNRLEIQVPRKKARDAHRPQPACRPHRFPTEGARLEVAVPTLFLGAVSTIGLGWTLQARTNLAGPLVLLFSIGFCTSSTVNTVSVLIVDLYPGKAGTATAANNMVRCWLGAGATGAGGAGDQRVGDRLDGDFPRPRHACFQPYVMVHHEERS